MEYDKLRLILPNEPKTWTIQDVGKWLQFIGLETLHPLFRIIFLICSRLGIY